MDALQKYFYRHAGIFQHDEAQDSFENNSELPK
jgi:hypothetical protein